MTWIMTPHGIAGDPEIPKSWDLARKANRLVEYELEDTAALVAETHPDHVARKKLERSESGVGRERREMVRGWKEKAVRTLELVSERQAQAKTPAVFWRDGHPDDSPRTLQVERTVLEELYRVDPVERLPIVRKLFEADHRPGIRALLDNPLEVIRGELIPKEELDGMLEDYSRRMLPKIWERIDTQASEAGHQLMQVKMTIEALERVTGVPLDGSGSDPIPL